ncbi:DUF3768 domain-containing protein [Erythrobacter sp. THAF29]|uniref:DUF3768 domain-containing protein n=1 Tax=Erythrobacter sp. THAF29 TaxID=2587851 RepID=UPI0012695F04|nr:DUF3768 domain-containing protein [Erythrobacter sp. THAF29]
MTDETDGSRETRTARIRELNDLLRKERSGGYMCVSDGVVALGYEVFCEIREKVKAFDAFTPANDPYGEHDFGSLVHNGNEIFWKIDYYDKSETDASPDPTDPSVTNRIITIMLAREY